MSDLKQPTTHYHICDGEPIELLEYEDHNEGHVLCYYAYVMSCKEWDMCIDALDWSNSDVIACYDNAHKAHVDAYVDFIIESEIPF